ncbi:uncharacterized protein [Porites lutea]|uniref:uncharacterized protein n=1 Tax=Porites lutea TaxID=51062 RepID=UPI003CC59F39
MSSTGQAWQDELQSFLPHALDCVDPKCVRPLCVNLKLTLRHAQHCEKGEQCHICQGMKTLAATHSNSCRNYYCNVPFCFQAKVATQQQMLMDELEKATEAVVDLGSEQVNQVLLKEAGDNNVNDSVSDFSFPLVPVTQTSKISPDGIATGLKHIPSSDQEVSSVAAENPQIVAEVPSVRKSVTDLECTKRSILGGLEFEPPKSAPPQQSSRRKRRSDPSKTEPTKTRYQQLGTKKRLSRGESIDKSLGPPSKVYRANSTLDLSDQQGFKPMSQPASRDQTQVDLPDCYIDEMYSTPPPSPTFKMWFDETIQASESSLKNVLLETLFQLLGVVTQPKTRQQEAFFVDLLERTLLLMRTEIAKE